MAFGDELGKMVAATAGVCLIVIIVLGTVKLVMVMF